MLRSNNTGQLCTLFEGGLFGLNLEVKHCEHFCSAAIHPVPQNQEWRHFQIIDSGFSSKVDLNDGQKRNQFSEIDHQLCVLDLWGWRFGTADPAGALRLEGSVKQARERDWIMKEHFALPSWLGLGVALTLALGVMSAPTMAADASLIVGNWEGTLDPGAQGKKRIVVHVSAAQDGSLSGTIDYPDENASGALITAITFNAPILHFESRASVAMFDGSISKDISEIDGVWKQGSASLKLTLKRTP
jgi:hypothetical protein